MPKRSLFTHFNVTLCMHDLSAIDHSLTLYIPREASLLSITHKWAAQFLKHILPPLKGPATHRTWNGILGDVSRCIPNPPPPLSLLHTPFSYQPSVERDHYRTTTNHISFGMCLILSTAMTQTWEWHYSVSEHFKCTHTGLFIRHNEQISINKSSCSP